MKYSDVSLSWFGDVTSISSNAHHARSIIRPLVEGGANVKLMPFRTGRQEVELDPWWKEHIKGLTEASPGLVMINHGQPGQYRPNDMGGPVVLFTHWETFEVPKAWVKVINSDRYSEVWVPNRTCTSSCKDISHNVVHIPYPIDLGKINSTKATPEIVGVNDNAFIFGAVGIYNNRKNMQDLIVAYLAEFMEIDNVALVIRTNHENHGDSNARRTLLDTIKRIKKGINKPGMPSVVLLQDTFSEDAMLSISRRFDAFVSTSRGEGRSISMMTAMAMGKPCVYLPTLANQDLTLPACRLQYPVDYVTEPVVSMGNYYSALDSWARPDLGSVTECMRKAYTDHVTKSMGKEAKSMKKFLEENYNKEDIVDLVAQRVRELSPLRVEDLAIPSLNQ